MSLQFLIWLFVFLLQAALLGRTMFAVRAQGRGLERPTLEAVCFKAP